MMKMIMRPDKTQFKHKEFQKFTASGSVRVNHMKMVGYQGVEALLIGAAGGRSGDAKGTSTTNTIQYRCGGGGGGSLHLDVPLSYLGDYQTVLVGAPGADGAASAVEGKAGDGGNGGMSTFSSYQALGGFGATGGQWFVSDTNNNRNVVLLSFGGSGGGNSEGLGTGGAGGQASEPYSTQNPYQIVTTNTSQPGNPGGYEENVYVPDPEGSPTEHDFNVIGGSRGGGGSPGRCRMAGIDSASARAGAAGGVTDLEAPGGAAETNYGGFGGGANAEIMTGIEEFYGSGAPGSNPGGLVVLRFY